MELLSIVQKLFTTSQALRTELVSVQISADTTTLTTVMGPACKQAGEYSTAELHQHVTLDSGLNSALDGTDNTTIGQVQSAVQALMSDYATRVSEAVYSAEFAEWETRITSPIIGKLGFSIKNIEDMTLMLEDLRHKATRLQSLSINSGPSNIVLQEYQTNIKFVCKTALKLSMYDLNIQKYSIEIDGLMFSTVHGANERAKEQQEVRECMIKERKVVEHGLITHFDSGSTQDRGVAKITLKDLKIPDGLDKGKGLELIQSVKAYLKNRSPQYYAIMSDLIRVLSESKIGKFYKPANAKNGYADVKLEIRAAYNTQSRELYDEICLKVPNKIMNDIRVSFKYGLEELSACCEVGDGPMAIFCLLALYRPASLVYRDSLRTSLEEGSHKFKDGANPAAKIKELRAIILEAIDLNVRVSWRLTGKGIVTVMSERGNNFAQILAKYNKVGGILDPEDCVVELNRMFTDIEEVIIQLETAGVDIKRVMAIKVMNVVTEKTKGKPGTNPAICWYNEDCTRPNCSFTHDKRNKGDKEKKGKGKGKGGKADSKGKGAGKGGRGQTAKNDICKAKGCTGPSRGWPLCNTCRREGLEKGSMTLKDGTKMPVTTVEKKTPPATTETRLALIEKHLTANATSIDDRGSDGEDEELELFTGGGAPKSVKIAAAKKRKRDLSVNTVSVFDRLSDARGCPMRRSTDAELEEEFNRE
jgi:hypothetical protein